MGRKPNRLAAAILAAVVALLIAYPLSIGPVAFLAQLIDFVDYENSPTGDYAAPAGELAMRFYWPIFHLPDPMRHWAIEWWNCGTRLAGRLWGQ